MVTVSFTDLRNHTKEYFEAVEKGETLQVCKRGRPIAVVSPARRPASEYWKHVRPLPIKLDGVSASQLIIEERGEGL
ncbi:MAG: type II toxin-antitoxin system prevent-host-death family antitoxin [Planctomycetes bacterium]|nr:type II toxin-antitoxin system prevent-host-death family antitoxin [Planctomycetota bacterium]